jgi:hypothetical protein
MAETFTYNETPADAPELNADEQDSLAVGEQMQADQEQLLAGKYKSTQDLENAYLELQKKIGERSGSEAEQPEEAEAEPETPESQVFLNDAASEWADKGELSSETMSKLTAMSSEDLVNAYLASAAPPTAPADLSDDQVTTIKDSVGGEEQYSKIVSWAGENLAEDQIKGFDSLVESGNAAAIQFAVAGLKAMYESNNGVDGQMITGKAPKTGGDSFKSQAELVAAMTDARYERDPAYRQEVTARLERSGELF